MADKIVYLDKVKVRDSVLPKVNKGTADDFNEIKAVVNSHADEIDTKVDATDVANAIAEPRTDITFIPKTAPTYEESKLWYDSDNNSLSYYDNISGTSIQIGKETVFSVRNNTGLQINNGQVVYISGATGQNPTVALAQSNAIATSQTIGVATHDIPNNTTGKITVQGLVNDINTSSFVDGDLLYVSSTVAGGLTATPPPSPDNVCLVGYVAYAHTTNGKILISPKHVLANNDSLGTDQTSPPTENAVKNYVDSAVGSAPNLYTQNGSIPTTTNREVTIPADSSLDLLGRVGIGKTPNTSAILDASVSNKGLRLPQGDEADMTGISTPADWMLFQRNDLNGAIWMYNPDALDWVPLTVGYGIIEVIRDSDNGVPSYYADLQTALETCKSGINTVTLHSNVIITDTISIKSSGTGIGNAYAFDMLTINLNGFEIKNNNADSTYCFDLLLSNSSGINRTLLFQNGKITRTSGTGTHYAIYSTTTANYGTLLFDKCIVYGQNSYGAYIGMQQSSDRLYDVNDFGGTLFISDSSYGLYVRNYNCKNFSVLGKSATSSAYLRNCTTQNYTVENTSTGIGLTMVGNISSSDFRVKSTTGKGLYCADDVTGDISNFVIETTTGDGIETTGTNPTYKPVFNNFTIICGNGVCIDSNHTNTEFNNFYLRNNGTSKTISEVNNGTRQYTNGNVINLGSGQAFDIFNVSKVKFTSVKFISTSECVGSISLDNSIYNVDCELCSFECNYDDATGNCVEILNSTGLIDISLSKFNVVNASANALYASASRTLNLSNSVFKGATTPINANVTITASTDLGNGNRQL